ncbi:MAG: hypothetical protein HWE18_05005 [Gammaproteobacteria bacterium]|nr:hypothetical protein [Gammaproteobacteria bacterium]
MEINKKIMASLLAMGLLTGCGSDSDSDSVESYGVDYTGKEESASVTLEDKDAIAASTIVAFETLMSSLRNEPNIFAYSHSANSFVASMNAYSDLIESEVGTETIPNVPVEGDCGGSVKVSGDYENFSFTASNFCLDMGAQETILVTANGSAEFTTNVQTDYKTFTFEQFSLAFKEVMIKLHGEIGSGLNEKENPEVRVYANLTIDGEKQALNLVRACDSQGENCNFDLEFSAEDGQVHKVIDSVLTQPEIESNQWQGYGKTYLADIGKLSFEFDSLTYCENGEINTADIYIWDNALNSLEITYSQCGVEPSVEFVEASQYQ